MNKGKEKTNVNPVKTFIKSLLLNEDLKISTLAKNLGTTRQNLNKKIENGSLRFADFIKIAALLGYKVELTKLQESKGAFICSIGGINITLNKSEIEG